MQVKFNSLTRKGHELINHIDSGNYGYDFQVTRVAVGSGAADENTDFHEMENLIRYEQDAEIAQIESKGNGLSVIEARVSNIGLNTGFFLREIGVYAMDKKNGAEILYAYIYADVPDWIAPFENMPVEKLLNLTTIISLKADITAVIDPSVLYVKRPVYENHMRLYHHMYDNSITVSHGLNTYPRALVIETSGGYGVDGYNEGTYGGGDSVEIKSSVIYPDTDTIKVLLERTYDGTPEIAKITDSEYRVSFGNAYLKVFLFTNHKMYDNSITVSHGLNTYPRALVIETSGGYGVDGYNEGPYGGGDSVEIKSIVIYPDMDTIKVLLERTYDGTPEIARITDSEYGVSFGNAYLKVLLFTDHTKLNEALDGIRRDLQTAAANSSNTLSAALQKTAGEIRSEASEFIFNINTKIAQGKQETNAAITALKKELEAKIAAIPIGYGN